MNRLTVNIAIAAASFFLIAIVTPLNGGVGDISDEQESKFKLWCRDSCGRLVEMLDQSCKDHSIYARCTYRFVGDSSQLIVDKHICFVVSDPTAYNTLADVNMVLGVLQDFGWPVDVGDTVSYVLSAVYLPSPIPELQYEEFLRVQELLVRNEDYIIHHDIVRARLAETRKIKRVP